MKPSNGLDENTGWRSGEKNLRVLETKKNNAYLTLFLPLKANMTGVAPCV
jgi:hypothetical protein